MAHKQEFNFDGFPLVSRAEAKRDNLTRYFTGKVCPQGHVAPRYTRYGTCVVCVAAASLAWQKRMYLADGDAYRARIRLGRKQHPVANLIRCARSRAKRKGLKFSITAADLSMPSTCPCCGGDMKMRTGPTKPGPTPQSPSIDRIDSALGYVKGNVAIICWRCNELKRNATTDELRKILRWMEQAKPKLALVG